MQIRSLLFSVFCLLTMAACHDHHADDANAPVLTIKNPIEGASLSGEIHIQGDVTDESLHEMEIKITKNSDGSELFKASPGVHNKKEFDFDEYFTPSVAAETAVTLTVTVVDHSDNTTTKTVKFTVKP